MLAVKVIIYVFLAAPVLCGVSITLCDSAAFQRYLLNNDSERISQCARDPMVRRQLCKSTTISGTILELPLVSLFRWKKVCSSEMSGTKLGRLVAEDKLLNIEERLEEDVSTKKKEFIVEIPLKKTQKRAQTQLQNPDEFNFDDWLPHFAPPRNTTFARPGGGNKPPRDGSGKVGALLSPREDEDSADGSSHYREHDSSRRAAAVSDTISHDLTSVCSNHSSSLDDCFRKGLENARPLVKAHDPSVFQMNTTGQSRGLSWALHQVEVAGLSRYQVIDVTARPSSAKHHKPLRVSTSWLTDVWHLKLSVSYRLPLLSEALALTRTVQVALTMPRVRMSVESDIWGQERPAAGIVKFFSEDKRFDLQYPSDEVQLSVQVDGHHQRITMVDTTIDLHVQHEALKMMWPDIEDHLRTVFQEVTNGQVIPVVIEFLLKHGIKEKANASRGMPPPPPPERPPKLRVRPSADDTAAM